jgi:hypothetical protein
MDVNQRRIVFRYGVRPCRWYFPLSHGIPRVDDRYVLSDIIFVIWAAGMQSVGCRRGAQLPSGRTVPVPQAVA